MWLYCSKIPSFFRHFKPCKSLGYFLRGCEVKFSSIIFFFEKFSLLLRDSKSAFEAESLRYQMAVLPENIISQERPDSQWSKLSKLKDNEGEQLYGNLSNFICKLLVLPHSNVKCEHIFSVIKRNKTIIRGSMDISILQSILIAKSDVNNACYSQQYDAAFLKEA